MTSLVEGHYNILLLTFHSNEEVAVIKRQFRYPVQMIIAEIGN
jgi:hypothetical protein